MAPPGRSNNGKEKAKNGGNLGFEAELFSRLTSCEKILSRPTTSTLSWASSS